MIDNEGDKKGAEPWAAPLEQILSGLGEQMNSLSRKLDALDYRLAALERGQKDALERLDWKPAQNIRRRLYELAGLDTAQYVLEHMNKVKAFNVVRDILPYAIGRSDIPGGGIMNSAFFPGKPSI